MIITKIGGGLGNQLFQYAVGRCIAHRRKTEYKLYPIVFRDTTDHHHNFYRLSAFNISENLATLEEVQSLHFIQQDWIYSWVFMPEVMDMDNICLEGSWQSEKYFLDIEDIIRREFTLKNPLGKISAFWKEQILSANCAVSVHVRHGDYLRYAIRSGVAILPVAHYIKCINELKKDFSDITVFVFSDDLEWCKENFKFDVTTKFVEGCEHDFEELYLMSICKHNIISRGTFAWWGAWLNQNPDKKVFAPYPWNISEPHGKDIIPESWIKIPAVYSSWPPPMLSIIVYVEDILSAIEPSFVSIFTQVFHDYEVILVDASLSDNNELYKIFGIRKNVTILRLSDYNEKFSAWNKGMEVAQGDYVTFLTTKNIFLYRATSILANVCDLDINKKGMGVENYIKYSTYENYTPNIICSTQILEEDERGEININGIPNKKFSLKVDSAFQNLNGLAEIEIPNHQKLMALGSQGINSLVGTKFFKRKFLNENKIRFNENEGVDAELKFIVDAFMSTEKITFIPQIFYGRLK